MITTDVLAALKREGKPTPEKAEFLARYFKTGEGQYGEGDIFLGVRVPETRRVAALYKDASLEELEALLESPIHEVRLCAVIIMANQYNRRTATPQHQKALFDLYLRRTDRINNWDIVDLSCRDVVGSYLFDHPERTEAVLHRLAASGNVWERRIAIVSTWRFICEGQLDQTFTVAALLLDDKHDLIHKATGWMLREAGKKDAAQLRDFLRQHITGMPRTTLRYAIEKFAPEERAQFLALK